MMKKQCKDRITKRYIKPKLVHLTVGFFLLTLLLSNIVSQYDLQIALIFSNFALAIIPNIIEYGYQNKYSKKITWGKWLCALLKESPLFTAGYVLSLLFSFYMLIILACVSWVGLDAISKRNIFLPFFDVINISKTSNIILGLFTANQLKTGVKLSQSWAQQEADEEAKKIRYHKGDPVA